VMRNLNLLGVNGFVISRMPIISTLSNVTLEAAHLRTGPLNGQRFLTAAATPGRPGWNENGQRPPRNAVSTNWRLTPQLQATK